MALDKHTMRVIDAVAVGLVCAAVLAGYGLVGRWDMEDEARVEAELARLKAQACESIDQQRINQWERCNGNAK